MVVSGHISHLAGDSALIFSSSSASTGASSAHKAHTTSSISVNSVRKPAHKSHAPYADFSTLSASVGYFASPLLGQRNVTSMRCQHTAQHQQQKLNNNANEPISVVSRLLLLIG